MSKPKLELHDETAIVVALRKAAGTDPYAFAKANGFQVSYLVNVLSGHQQPSNRLARILGFEPSARRWIKISEAVEART